MVSFNLTGNKNLQVTYMPVFLISDFEIPVISVISVILNNISRGVNKKWQHLVTPNMDKCKNSK